MLNLSLQNLAKLLGAGYQGQSNVFAKGVAIDSRHVKKGDLFFAFKGEKTDGHQFIDNALEKGAVGAVVSDLGAVFHPEGKNLLICQNPYKLLQNLAKLVRQNMQIPVIAITGSTGKTTTKDLTFSILQKAFNTIKTEGNFNNELGLPLTLCRLDKTHEALVLEMGMRGLGQIDFLCKLAQPTHGIITNIGQVHAEILGSQEKIAQAKAEILQYIPEYGTVALNIADRKLLELWTKDIRAKVFWFGLESQADIWAKDIEYLGEWGSRFKVCFGHECREVEIKIPGEHNIINALAAIGTARSLGVDWDSIQEGLADVQLTGMRLQIETSSHGVKIINDTYNANPTSMEAAIKVLVQVVGKRKIAVLGDMYELGIYEEKGHKLMGKIAFTQNVDLLIAVGKLGKLIGVGATEAGMDSSKVIYANNNDDALKILTDILAKDDIVLIKGSRGMKMEDIVYGLMR